VAHLPSIAGVIVWKSEKCVFLLAEKRKKWKMFFSHTAGSLGTGLWGVSGHMACKVSVFVLPSAIA